MEHFVIFTLLVAFVTTVSMQKEFRPCNEISRDLRFPCKCALGPAEGGLNGNPAVFVDCDHIVFANDLPSLPYGAPIVSYSQKHAGHQSLPTQVFSSTSFPLRTIDLSGNSLRRLTETILPSFQNTLIELRLADNLLGDTLNPIFSSNEFHALKHLQILDLSGNSIKALEEGIFEGCKNLNELYLDRNSLKTIPSSSLNGPKNLRILSLKNNRIGSLKTSSAFQSQLSLETIDLSYNLITSMEGGTFDGLENLKRLRLSYNKLSKFNSDVFHGVENLISLDLAENFITEFPTVASKAFEQLRYLNLSSNLIQNLNNNDLNSLTHLYSLDLSRNNIGNIVPGTFLGLKQLRKLDISVNSLRTIEDDAFEGLDNLDYLNVKDNNILLIPASALGRLPKLSNLQLDYNRIAAISGDILRSIAEHVTNLDISKNIVRELPPASFQYFQKLKTLELSRNLIINLNSNAFSGLENTLQELYLGQNRITTLSGTPIVLNKLKKLDLSENHLTELARNTFSALPSLKHLNLSHNMNLKNIPVDVLHRLEQLTDFDFSYTTLKILPSDFFSKSKALQHVNLKHNMLTELNSGIFSNLHNLTTVDLSYNNLNNIRQSAFVNVMNIKVLILKGNQLSSFKGELFNTGTSLEILDISDNQLSYLFPSSFRIHPRLREIHAANNKFNFFPAELIATLQYLEYIDLSGNALKIVDELDYARLPRLRQLNLAHNQIESFSEMAFHNSTQLQILDLSYNKLDRLNERTFEGLVRIEMLNLESNQLSDLPDTIFDRSRLHMLENINLARNKFETAPLKALQRQYFFISSVDLSHNKIKDIPADDSILVNIKKLDLSFNPLSNDSITNLFGEPKTVRELNLAGTGISKVIQLETPFLNYLNLSHNNITSMSERVFERTSLLETLDLSNNNIQNLEDIKLSSLKNLQNLNLSNNPIEIIAQNDFTGLEGLKKLDLNTLISCVRIEKAAFKNVPNLVNLDLTNVPKLGYLDIPGLLAHLPGLEVINFETKDAAIGPEQFQSALNSRLRELGISGSRLRSITSGTFSGIKAPEIILKLQNSSLSSLPPALFFAVPRSSKIHLDVTGSQLTTITPQMLVTLDDRRGDLKIVGLESNPVVCDCNARALRRWLPSHMTKIRCSAPEYFAGKLLVEIGDDELTCDVRKTTTTQKTTTKKSTTKYMQRTTEPEIIWSVEPTTEKIKTKTKPALAQSTINNEDTLIIAIVGGVIAFIIILIIIICIIRLKMSSTPMPAYHGPPMMGMTTTGMLAPPQGPGSTCACSVKSGAPPPVYGMPPAYATSTLPHKFATNGTLGPASQSVRASNYSTMGRVPYYQNNGFFVATYPSDEKIYR